MEPRPGRAHPAPCSPKDLLLTGGKISGRKKSIPGCKTSFQDRKGFGNAGASPQLARADGEVDAEGCTQEQLSLKILC